MESRKCNKQGINNFLFLYYYIQVKWGNIANKYPNAADDDEQTFNYRWPYAVLMLQPFQIAAFWISEKVQQQKMLSLNSIISAILKCFRQLFCCPIVWVYQHSDFVPSNKLKYVVEATFLSLLSFKNFS